MSVLWLKSFWFYQCFALRLLGYSILNLFVRVP